MKRWPTEPAHALQHDARHDVARAAGGERHDDGDRARRIVLRNGAGGGEEERVRDAPENVLQDGTLPVALPKRCFMTSSNERFDGATAPPERRR